MYYQAKPKIIALVGPTASGKSALGVELSLLYNGEVVSCDSRQVYQGLNLGSGKITPVEMKGVPHHLLDVAAPTQVYTVADYVSDAGRALKRILERNHLPIVVGGSFMYLDSLLGKISLPAVPPNHPLRHELEKLSNEELILKLTALDQTSLDRIDTGNRRRLIRAIEVAALLGYVPASLPKADYTVLIIGIKIDRHTLKQNIKKRLHARLDLGLIDEVKNLLKSGVTPERLESLGLEYRYVSRHLAGELTEAEMVEKLITKIYQYAKRQETWLKKDTTIKWFSYPVTTTVVKSTIDDFLLAKTVD